MINEEKQTVVILQSRMAGWLMFKGCVKVNEKEDLKDSKRKIYIFEDTPKLQKAMNDYKNYKDIAYL